jgi:peroxiredoxin
MKPISILLAAIISCCAIAAQVPNGLLKVGDKAPDFALPDVDGKMIKLSDFVARGPVVVIFYRGFW